MKRVLLFSHTTGYQLRAFNDAAEALGIELIFATDRCHKLDDPWKDRAIPVRFHEPDASLAAIVEHAAKNPVAGVIAVGDRPVALAARAASALGRPWHSVAGAEASTDKRRSRAILAAAGLPAPSFSVISTRSPIPDPRLPFPVVLKPVGLSGSRGVIRANSREEFDAAFDRIRALLARPQVRAARTGLDDEILVEQYIDGREYALEGVLTGGDLRVFALFDKPDPLEGPYFEESIYVTPSRAPADTQGRIVDHVRRASRALGLSHGPIHAECRVMSDGTVHILEVAARPIGGLCSRVLAFQQPASPKREPGSAREGWGLEHVLLEHALGRSIAAFIREGAAAAVMMIPIPSRGMYKGVSGEAEARAVPGITDVRITAKAGQLLETLPEAGSYLGFIFARGATPVDAEASVRQAHARLAFAISAEIAVTPAC